MNRKAERFDLARQGSGEGAGFSSAKARAHAVTIAGELNLDLILRGLPVDLPINREVLADGFEATLGSSSAILAHNLARLGVAVGFITRVGHDEFGKLALSLLADSGVDLSRVTETDGETGTGVTVLLTHGRDRRILTYPGTMAEMTGADLDLEYLASSRHFHLSSLFLQTGLHADLPRILSHFKEKGLSISLDTNDDPKDEWGGVLDAILPFVDVLLPNEDEVKRIARKTSVEEAVKALDSRVPLIIVKCGRRGSLVHLSGQSTWVAPVEVSPIDTIGAGDSFNAGFLSAYLEGKSAVYCAAKGNIAGALSTLRAGGINAFRDTRLREQFFNDHAVLMGEDQ